jgi:hypothetical protein
MPAFSVGRQTMANRKNIFTDDLKDFLESVANTGHYKNFVAWQMAQSVHSMTRSLDVVAKQGRKNEFGAGNCQAIVNLLHKGEWVVRSPYGVRFSQGAKLLPMAQEMEGRFNSLILVSLYELFEVYIKRVYGKFLYQQPAAVNPEARRDFNAQRPETRNLRGTPEYYRLYAEAACKRQIRTAIKAIHANLDMSRLTIDRVWNLAWDELIDALGFCRNCIVHDGGHVEAEKLKRKARRVREFVAAQFRKGVYDQREAIMPSGKFMDSCFELLGSYAWALYVLMSERCDMENEAGFFQPADGTKRRIEIN